MKKNSNTNFKNREDETIAFSSLPQNPLKICEKIQELKF